VKVVRPSGKFLKRELLLLPPILGSLKDQYEMLQETNRDGPFFGFGDNIWIWTGHWKN